MWLIGAIYPYLGHLGPFGAILGHLGHIQVCVNWALLEARSHPSLGLNYAPFSAIWAVYGHGIWARIRAQIGLNRGYMGIWANIGHLGLYGVCGQVCGLGPFGPI